MFIVYDPLREKKQGKTGPGNSSISSNKKIPSMFSIAWGGSRFGEFVCGRWTLLGVIFSGGSVGPRNYHWLYFVALLGFVCWRLAGIIFQVF